MKETFTFTVLTTIRHLVAQYDQITGEVIIKITYYNDKTIEKTPEICDIVVQSHSCKSDQHLQSK